MKQQERASPVSHDFHVQGGTRAPTVPRGAAGVRASISEVRQVSAPVLLARPGYGGTIAAIRDLAQDQIPVSVLAESLLECGRWSNHVSATIPTGPQSDPKALLASLEKLTEDGTGPVAPVLLPTCDTSAWTYAAYADKLSPHFCLYAPPLETMQTGHYWTRAGSETACTPDAGVHVLKSWTVWTEAAIAQIADTLVFPLIIICRRTHVRRRAQLTRARSWRTMINSSERLSPASGDRRGSLMASTASTPTGQRVFSAAPFVDVLPARGSSPSPGSMDRSGISHLRGGA